jgi:hypothetical protein
MLLFDYFSIVGKEAAGKIVNGQRKDSLMMTKRPSRSVKSEALTQDFAGRGQDVWSRKKLKGQLLFRHKDNVWTQTYLVISESLL